MDELREAGKLETTDWVPLFNQRLLLKEVYDYVIWDVLVMPVVYSVLGDAISQLKHPFQRLDDPKLQAESAEKFAMLTAKKAKLGDKTWIELVEQKTGEILKASQTAGFDPSVREGKTGGCSDWSELHC